MWIQDEIGEWAIKADIGVMMVFAVPEYEDAATDACTTTITATITTTAAASVPVDLAMRFVNLISRVQNLEATIRGGVWR